MIKVRRPRLLAIGLPILVVIFILNHLEYHHRKQVLELRGKWKNQVAVKAGGGPTGHNTISIDESSISGGKMSFLHFATLGAWDFDPQANTPCPENIQALSGHSANCIGFMYPLEAGNQLKAFCLLRSTQTCCYGPRPQYNQYLFVEMSQPVKFERLAPVLLEGKFFVDPQPDQGFIYRMEGTSLSPVEDDVPEIDAAAAAQQANIPLFDFQALAAFEKNQNQGLPAELASLNGRQVVLNGFLIDRSQDTPPHILVSDKWWDGMTQGTPPTLFNAVMVIPANIEQTPPIWKQRGTFTGHLQVSNNPDEWSKNGIVCLQNAIIGVPGTTSISNIKNSGPKLSMYMELIISILFLALTLGGCGKYSVKPKA